MNPRLIKGFVDESSAPVIVPVLKQSTPWSCGAAAISVAAAYLNVQLTEAQSAALAGTNPKGTSEEQLISGVEMAGLKPSTIALTEPNLAVAVLKAALSRIEPVILCVDHWSHWVVALPPQGGGVIVQDPEDGTAQEYTDQELVNRWWCSGARDPFFGVVVSR